MKILVLVEQFCDGNHLCGFSQPATHYFGHFRHNELRVIYWDSVPPDRLNDFVQQALREKPDLCVFTGPPHPLLPSDQILQWIGSNTKLVALWHDVAKGGYRNIPGAALNVGMDGVESCPLPNFLPLWTPLSDQNGFSTPAEWIRPHDLTHPGSRGHKGVGREVEAAIQRWGMSLRWIGGQREDQMTWPDYFQTMMQSKVVVDFPRDVPGMAPQLKGRVFESVHCGACLLTEDHSAIRRHFEPEKEVMLYKSPDECAEQCERLLKDPQLRIRTAQMGQRRFNAEWTAEHWWKKLLEAL